MSEHECAAIKLIYELSEIVYHDLPDNSFARERIIKLREKIRETYDESVYK